MNIIIDAIVGMALWAIVFVILIGLIYGVYKFGPIITNYIKSVIRFNSNKHR